MSKEYWNLVRKRAHELNSDGCSGVPDFYLDCCLEHDIAYRTGKTITGRTQTREEADLCLRECIQARSLFGKWSPMSWWRYWAVRLLAKKSWQGVL